MILLRIENDSKRSDCDEGEHEYKPIKAEAFIGLIASCDDVYNRDAVR